MEKLCSIKGSKLYFNGEELLKIESIEKIEVKTLPVRQAIKSQLLNSMATFMSGSLINGNEQCIVGLNIIQKDKKEIWIPFHEGSVTRFNLDYHQYVKNARELKDKILKYIEYNGEEQNINVFWDVEEFLYAGNYRVDIFEGGNLIGSQSFTLN